MSCIFRRKTRTSWTYCIRVQVDGHPRYKSLNTKNLRRANAVADMAETELRAKFAAKEPETSTPEEQPGQPETEVDEPGTLTYLLKMYCKWATKTAARRSRTIESREWAVNCWKRHAQTERMDEITRKVVKEFVQSLIADGCTAHTVNDALRGLSTIVNRALTEEWWIGPNEFAKVERLKTTKRRIYVMSNDERDRLLWSALFEGPRAFLFTVLGLEAGFRKMEICWASWDWVDFDRNQIWVQESEHFHPKDHEERVVAMSPFLREVLEHFRQPSGFIIAPETPAGTYNYRIDVRKTFAKAIKNAGIPRVTPHVLRHSFASRLIEAGTPIGRVARYMGHSVTQTTEIYLHLIPEFAAA